MPASDLALAPGPLTDLFPAAECDPAPFSLSREQVARFERDGFVAGLRILDDRQLEAVRDAVQEVIADLERHAPLLYEVEQAFSERPGEVVCHFLGGWRVHPVLHDLVFHPAVTVPCAQLLGVDRLRFWHDQVFAKPPRHPGVVPFHQDYSYWTRTAPACHITLNLVLDDSTEASGCLQFVPGSHRLGLLPKVAFDGELEGALAGLAPGTLPPPVPAPLPAGSASLHHSHTLHGSAANRSDRWRRAVVLNYMGPLVRVADGSAPLLAGVPHLPEGSLVEGPYFPIVWSSG